MCVLYNGMRFLCGTRNLYRKSRSRDREQLVIGSTHISAANHVGESYEFTLKPYE